MISAWERAIFTLPGIEREYYCSGNDLSLLVYKDKSRWVVGCITKKDSEYYRFRWKWMALRKARKLMEEYPRWFPFSEDSKWKRMWMNIGRNAINFIDRIIKYTEFRCIRRSIRKKRIRDSVFL